MMKNKSITILFIIICLMIMPGFVQKAYAETTDAFTLNVEYPEDIKCGQEITFTLKAKNYSDESNLVYHLDGIDLYDEDGSRYLLMDPTKLPAYNSSDTRNFTFYTSGKYIITFAAMDKAERPVSMAKKTLEITINDPDYPSVDKLVKEIAAQCNDKFDNDYDKALYMHDYLIANAKYDNSLMFCNAEGVLARGKGTCESYHRAYCKLLNAVGIETGRMEGNGHVWTAVKLEGSWYQVDVTWDDPGYTDSTLDIEHLYFGLTDETMTQVHSDHMPVENHLSNSYECNYFIRSGKIRKYSDPVKEKILAAINEGNRKIDIDMSDDSMNVQYKKVMYPLIAYQLSNKETESFDGYDVQVKYDRENSRFTCNITENCTCDTFKTVITKAKLTTNGKIETICAKCGKLIKTDIIYRPDTIVLSTDRYVYSGAERKPAATVWDLKEKKLVNKTDYTVKYKNNVNAGVATAVITFKGKYSGTVNVPYIIVPKATNFTAISNTATGINLKWTKNVSATGYKIYRSVNGGKYVCIKTINSNSTVSYTDAKAVSNGARYQYRIVAYKSADGNNYYSSYSQVKTIYRLSKPVINSIIAHSGAITVKWNSNSKATVYQIQYSTNARFASGNKVIDIKNIKTLSRRISNLRRNSRYYLRIRVYKASGKVRYYSAWSNIRQVITKK